MASCSSSLALGIPQCHAADESQLALGPRDSHVNQIHFLSHLPAGLGPLYEYACHEGNYAMGNILRGARLKEANDSKKTKQ